MEREQAVGDHWAKDDVYARVVAALERAGKSLDRLTIEDVAPIDHLHARGFPATIELGDRLPVKPGHRLLDIGCGLGGPARYFAQRFRCTVSGIDITAPFVDAGRKLTALLRMDDRVHIEHGDGTRLPFADASFDGAYTQHVTMNVADRAGFFAEAFRVLRPGAFFALTEHGLGPTGDPHYPLPWSDDGSGSHLITPEETERLLAAARFTDIVVEEKSDDYVQGYKQMMERVAREGLPPLGVHVLLGESAAQKQRNAARNIEERRARPIQIVCRRR
ncbi:MAG TPA: class I SAM-dependent methyltransferase [Methylomirabilota bacterium]|jgi:SAM-dependent methyltransferase